MSSLRQLHCTPQHGAALAPDEVARRMREVDGGWRAIDGAIERELRFANYHETIAFVNAIAWIAHRQDHHPDLRVGYDRCVVRWSTHSVGGLSINDFICAARVDALLARDAG